MEAKNDRVKKLFLEQEQSQTSSLDQPVEDSKKFHKIKFIKELLSKILNHPPQKNPIKYSRKKSEVVQKSLSVATDWRDKYDVGRDSYGSPRIFSWGERSTLKVGKFCSIAEEVKIFLGGNHRSDWVTTFPFSALWPSATHITGHPTTRGDVLLV